MKKMLLGLLLVAAAVPLGLQVRSHAPVASEPQPAPVPAEAQEQSPPVPETVASPAPPALTQAPAVASLAEIERETDADRREEALEATAAAVAEADIPPALEHLLSDAGRAAAELRQSLVRRWAEAEPAAAADWVTKQTAGPARSEMLQQVAVAYADADLSAAADWAKGLPDEGAKQTVSLALAGEAARANPVTALTVGGGLPPSPERDELLVHAISQWAVTDPTGAADWAKEVSDPLLRQRLLGAVAIALAAADGNAAATLAASAMPPGAVQDYTAVAVAQRWAQASPQAAAAWVAQFPDSQVRTVAEENLRSLEPSRAP